MATRPTPFLTPLLGTILIAPALVAIGCDGSAGSAASSPVPAGFERVTINDRTFTLELAADEAKREKGLGDRAEIPPDGGMLFVFRDAAVRQFVMRDCLVPIDIIFVDASGRVTATHSMPIEPRNPGEDNRTYELRLKRFGSRYAAQYVIELAGGTLPSLGVTEGQPIDLDLERLKALAR